MYSKEEVIEVSKKVLKDLQKDLFSEDNIVDAIFKLQDSYPNETDESFSTWTIVVEERVFGNSFFLIISDNTGEPLYTQSKHILSKIRKDSEGVYFKIST